jgi:hypothetical protein
MFEYAAAVLNETDGRSAGIHLSWRHAKVRSNITVREGITILCTLSKRRDERSGLQPLLFRYYPCICPIHLKKTLKIPVRVGKI